MTIPQQECKEKKVLRCELVPREECRMVPEEKCTQAKEDYIAPGLCRINTGWSAMIDQDRNVARR